MLTGPLSFRRLEATNGMAFSDDRDVDLAACSSYNALMRLPNGERAIVEERKLREYVLNVYHPVGRHHAALFRELLGIGAGNFEVLRTALLRAAATEAVTAEVRTAHGVKYEMSVEVSGPRGTKGVRAIWIIDEGAIRPRLVTCFVE